MCQAEGKAGSEEKGEAMSLKLFDARCDTCRHVTEVFGELDDTFRCEQDSCNGIAKRIISPIRCSLDGASGDFPGEAMKWEKRHMKKDFNQGGSY